MKLVFDTYAWVEYFIGSEQGKQVEEYFKTSEVITPTIVLLELSAKSYREGWDIKKYLDFIKINSKITGINDKFVIMFGKVYNKVKHNVKGFSIADGIVLTSAVIEDAKIITGDGHFSGMDNVIMLK